MKSQVYQALTILDNTIKEVYIDWNIHKYFL